MTHKEKLVELLMQGMEKAQKQNIGAFLAGSLANILADHLIENGVIVPPCKVGDTIYIVEDYGYKKEIIEQETGCLVIKGTNDFSRELWQDIYGGVICSFNDFEKNAFLTKEEAEKALAEKRVDNG